MDERGSEPGVLSVVVPVPPPPFHVRPYGIDEPSLRKVHHAEYTRPPHQRQQRTGEMRERRVQLKVPCARPRHPQRPLARHQYGGHRHAAPAENAKREEVRRHRRGHTHAVHRPPSKVVRHLRRERRVFQRILHEGQASGEFCIDNVAATTIALHAATTKYRYAQLFTNQTLSELERELAHVMTVILRGLMPSKDGKPVAETTIPSEETAPLASAS